jgi:hypothetical protein
MTGGVVRGAMGALRGGFGLSTVALVSRIVHQEV